MLQLYLWMFNSVCRLIQKLGPFFFRNGRTAWTDAQNLHNVPGPAHIYEKHFIRKI